MTVLNMSYSFIYILEHLGYSIKALWKDHRGLEIMALDDKDGTSKSLKGERASQEPWGPMYIPCFKILLDTDNHTLYKDWKLCRIFSVFASQTILGPDVRREATAGPFWH